MVEVVVEYNYDAEQPDELSIKPGDIIKNVIMVEGGWWEGELNGKKGMFPDNFVKVVKNQPEVEKRDDSKKKQVQASKRQSVKDLANKLKDSVHEGPPMMRRKESGTKKKKAKVVFSYDPENDDELKLSVGESIEVLKQEEEGWWEGILNGKQGMFPSNFVEILDDTETPEPEKTDPSEEETLIKGKKVHGVGLGNIFGAGPIKLRSTTGKKPADRPLEPPKIEKRTEASVRKTKDASVNPTNLPRAYPHLVMDTSSEYVVVRCDDMCEIVEREDRHNLNNSSEIDKDRHAMCYIDSSHELRENISFDAEESFKDYDESDLSATDFTCVKENTVDITNVSDVSQDYAFDMQEFVQSNSEIENSGSQYIVDSSEYLESMNEPDVVKESGDYSESLKTILDDLDSCLDQSVRDDENVDENFQNSSTVSNNKGESIEGVQCYCVERESGDDFTGVREGRHRWQSKEINSESTPIKPIFDQAIDSVVVTKKRFVSTSKLASDQTPVRRVYEREGLMSEAEEPQTNVPTPLYLSSTTKHQQVTYLTSLNSAGHLSPFMRSIANKYKLFEQDKPKFKDIDLGVISDDTDEETYSTFLMGHTLDASLASEDNRSDTCGENDNQVEVSDMVRNYVYDVLAGADEEPKKSESCVKGLDESDIALAREDYRPEDDESLMVCIDEYSARFMDASSKDNLSVDQDYRTEDEEDSLSSDGGVLLTMTEGNDSSPPLSCCSSSLYPCLELNSTGKPGEEVPDTYPLENRPHEEIMSWPLSKTGLDSTTEGWNQGSSQSLPRYKTFSALSCHKDKKYTPTRVTSSYCRIPFKDDAPTFWFKKDFDESPGQGQSVNPLTKARSPKRSISQVLGTFPSLFSLAEKVYMDDFRLKIEAFKTENLSVLGGDERQFFFNGRSPARKKRRRSPANTYCERLSPRIALNFNSNALSVTDKLSVHNEHMDPELCGSIDTYFAEKIETPDITMPQVLSSKAEVDFKSVSCSALPKSTKVDWSEFLFDKKKLKSQSFHRRKVKHDPVRDSQVQVVDHLNPKANERHHTSSRQEYLNNFMNECSEKRRKRRFTPWSKTDLHDDSVQLVSYHKLDENSSNLYEANRNPSRCVKWEREKRHNSSKTTSLADLILQKGASAFVSPDKRKHSPQVLPRHKVLELMKQIADESSNDVMSYFDHGDEADACYKQPPQEKYLQNSNEETVCNSLDKSITSLQEAVDEHAVSSSQDSQGLTHVIKMLDTRQKLYEAISEAVSFCANEIEKEMKAEDDSEIDDTLESVTKPNEMHDLTPDPEALANDLNSIDLSGTPVYATSQGDSEIKAFLNEAMESFDNILIDSFASSSDSLTEESPLKSVKNNSLKNVLNDTSEPVAGQEGEDEGDDDTIELQDDSVLAIIGKQCILHEEVVIDSKVLCPGDTSVEVLDDSILNVVGRECRFHIQDACTTAYVPKLKDICCMALKRIRQGAKTTLRIRDNVYNCDYDEVFELEDDGSEQPSPTGQRFKRNVPLLPIVRTVIQSDGRMKAVLTSDTSIPGYFSTHSTLEQGIEIGMPDYESSPVLKTQSDGNVAYYKMEDSLVEEDELVLPEGSASVSFNISIHNNSPVNIEDSCNGNRQDVLEELSFDSFRNVPDIDERLQTSGHGSVDDFIEDILEVTDDSSWVEELRRASNAGTPGSESGDMGKQSLISDCPPVFDQKLSSYPSPKS